MKSKLIRIFERVRDIPYRIPLKYGEKDKSCGGKGEMLCNLLLKDGYKTRKIICTFLWNELNLPKKILKLPHDKECTHMYVEVFLNKRWVILDSTWDKKLKSVFYINEWDGKTNTEIAVRPTKTFSPRKSISIIKSQSSKKAFEEDMRRNGEFYKAINLWFNEVRKGLAI